MTTKEFIEIQDAIQWDNGTLAKWLGVSRQAVEHWRSGRRHITSRTAVQMELLSRIVNPQKVYDEDSSNL